MFMCHSGSLGQVASLPLGDANTINVLVKCPLNVAVFHCTLARPSFGLRLLCYREKEARFVCWVSVMGIPRMTLDLASTLGLFSVFRQRFSTENIGDPADQVGITRVDVAGGQLEAAGIIAKL